MGRKRKTDSPLPKYVYLAKGRYVYRPYRDGKIRGEILLCPGDSPISKVWQAYEAAIAEHDVKRSLSWLFAEYFKSDLFRSKAVRTRKDYESYAKRILGAKLRNGSLFGEVEIDRLTPGVIRKFMDSRPAKVTANRELAFMSAVFSWAYERDMVKLNPCKGVSRNVEKPREVYVLDDDYLLVYQLAGKRYRYLQPIMELAYLCRLRLAEVLDLTKANIKPNGLLIVRRKNSRGNITTWTPRLRAAVDQALALPRKIAQLHDDKHHLIPSRDGGRLRESTVQTAWQRLIKEALESGLEQRFTCHDLKAKGITDTERADKLAASGHRDPRMLNVYDRLPPLVKPSKE